MINDDNDSAWADHELNERRRYETEGHDMKFAAKKSIEFALVPAGNHVGICNAVVDFGLQPGSGKFPDPKHIVCLRFELPGEQITYMKDEKEVIGPMSISARYTASMSAKANLRKFIESWFGKKFPNDNAASDFDLKLLLGRRCLLNVTHTESGDKVYANIATATPLPKGMVSTEPQHNPSLYFSLNDTDQDAMDLAYDAMPKWMRETIDNRLPTEPPAKKIDTATGEVNEFDSEIPF